MEIIGGIGIIKIIRIVEIIGGIGIIKIIGRTGGRGTPCPIAILFTKARSASFVVSASGVLATIGVANTAAKPAVGVCGHLPRGGAETLLAIAERNIPALMCSRQLPSAQNRVLPWPSISTSLPDSSLCDMVPSSQHNGK